MTLWDIRDVGIDDEGNAGSMLANRKYGLYDDEDYLFLEYTGLKDKNGKEIYEGDIWRRADGYISTVRWLEGGAQFTVQTTPYPLIEVIGNIYENPELLKNDSSTR